MGFLLYLLLVPTLSLHILIALLLLLPLLLLLCCQPQMVTAMLGHQCWSDRVYLSSARAVDTVFPGGRGQTPWASCRELHFLVSTRSRDCPVHCERILSLCWGLRALSVLQHRLLAIA